MTNESEVKPIPYNEVTEAQVFDAYQDNELVQKLMTWEEAKESEPMYIALKRQASCSPLMKAKQGRVENMVTKKDRPLSVIEGPLQLSRSEVRTLRATLALCRNALQSSSPSTFTVTEACAAIYYTKKSIDKKLVNAQAQKEAR